MENEKELLSVREVAARFGVHPQSVYRWATEGLLPKYFVGRGMLRFRREDVDALVRPTRGRPTTSERKESEGE